MSPCDKILWTILVRIRTAFALFRGHLSPSRPSAGAGGTSRRHVRASAPNDPRVEARRTGAVLDSSAVGGVHEAAGQWDAATNRAVARDKSGAASVVIRR